MKQYFINSSEMHQSTPNGLGLKDFKSLDKKEYRRQMHLLCEHRRRGQIQTALNDLQKIIIVKNNSRPVSKISIITETIGTILKLEQEVRKMEENIREASEAIRQINKQLKEQISSS